MTEMKKLEKLEKLARDLRKGPPRGPRETLGGYVILGRCVDKCRAELVGVNGEYTYWPCTLCSFLEPFSGLDLADLVQVSSQPIGGRHFQLQTLE